MTERRKKFYEEIGERTAMAMMALIDEFPELEGAAVVLLYAEDVGNPPAEVIVAEDTEDPMTLSRIGMQLSTVLGKVGMRIGQKMAQAHVVGGQLRKEANVKGTDAPGADQAQTGDAGVGHIGRPYCPPEDH